MDQNDHRFRWAIRTPILGEYIDAIFCFPTIFIVQHDLLLDECRYDYNRGMRQFQNRPLAELSDLEYPLGLIQK
jgi:hypothetical protein